MSRLAVNSDRLFGSLMELGKIGAFRDEATGLMGVNRLALTDADAEGRRQVKRWFEEAGLELRVDQIGNVIGRRRGKNDALAPVMSGSHIDSVPTGGAFDGALGVLGALEVVRTLNDRRIDTTRPIEIAYFTDEEGARFGHDMLGSAVAAGRLSLDHALQLSDADGRTVGAELLRIGFRGEAPARITRAPHAYVECHIEQGPILRAAQLDLGVVTGVQAISWQELTITGKSAHAGTTPMSLRKDPGYAAALLNVKLNEMARSGRYGEQMRATMGRIDPHPNKVNIVPSKVICTVDLRNPADEGMAAAERDVLAYYAELERTLGVELRWRQTARTPEIRFSEQVQRVIQGKMEAAGHSFMRLQSGAGHDAQEISAICPAAMIFVPGEYDGISHNPREYSTPEACARGVGIQLETILALAES